MASILNLTNGKIILKWKDPNDGRDRRKTCGTGQKGWINANLLKDRIEREILMGTYKRPIRTKTWAEFRTEFMEVELVKSKDTSARSILNSIDRFKQLMDPPTVAAIDARMIEEFIVRRSRDLGKVQKDGAREGIELSTLKKDLKNLGIFLKCAKRWLYINEIPEFKKPKGMSSHTPEFFSDDQFRRLYRAADHARSPNIIGVEPAIYWKALFTFLYLTGWRIGQTLALRWQDIEDDIIYTDRKNTKNKRDAVTQVHQLALDHLDLLRKNGSEYVFGVDGVTYSTLYTQFQELQTKAKISPRWKRWFGFHDLRRTFATKNEKRLSLSELQIAMNHKSVTTTQRYIGHDIPEIVERLHVPKLD